MVESEDFDHIKLRVDLTGKETQRVFDQVLKNLARSAPPFPGLRKLKGGEPSNLFPVLLNVLLIKYRRFAGGLVPVSNTCGTPILSKQIPKSFLFDVFGKDTVTEFVVNEIVTSTMCDYVKKARKTEGEGLDGQHSPDRRRTQIVVRSWKRIWFQCHAGARKFFKLKPAVHDHLKREGYILRALD
ncbi:hypothetical protein RHMOL_Rhmol02G0092400 [Rhododendron molle]|uniref:Uncharacterized protein n=1 Tax=Rhododendron molle TaxID=49168 RepID=A0ACC0PRA6_RHOML|nr:hypothetical protein RHMOL_Rhmol02G0092400 [Rhododendron molle]